LFTRHRSTSKKKSTRKSLFSDFNGIPEGADKTEFYQHDQNWSNRMILGDSLQVMASLAEREGLRGKVQCIYFDPPYGIKFNSNFQWSTTSRDVKDGNAGHITREPEQVKAFRDTWRDGIHSYLTYLRDRLTVARDLLNDSGSIFVQISDENLHRVRLLLDDVFGDENFVSLITVRKTGAVSSPEAKLNSLGTISDYVVWFAKRKETLKYRQLFSRKAETSTADQYRLTDESGNYQSVTIESNGYSETFHFPIRLFGKSYTPASTRHWSTTESGIYRVASADRVIATENKLRFKKYLADFSVSPIANIWADVMGSSGLIYVVQTNEKIVERCLLMATDPGDLVLDPTCGSGTTATVAEQWGRRWITIDTSRVALALARARIMGARYPYYLLADSREGQIKEGEVTRTAPSTQPARGNIRHGFVYERVPHVTLKSIANNAEIDVIWDKWQATLEPIRTALNKELGANFHDWEIPRELSVIALQFGKGKIKTGMGISEKAVAIAVVGDKVAKLHADWWTARIARQKEIDASIAAKAEFEFLYDKPYDDKKKVRVAGPFTVESLSPHRMLGVDENDELIDSSKHQAKQPGADYTARQTFPQMIMENLRTAGVQQAHKEDKITFTALVPWPGDRVCAEGRYLEGAEGDTREKRAGIFIGPEFGTVQRSDLVEAARECGDADFDVLIACAFNYEAHATEFSKLGRIPVLKARMNADLHMADDLKNTGKGNLFVIFGEPDIAILDQPDGTLKIKVNGVDVFHPQTGKVHSDNADGIACWFIDTDYNEESFFVRHAYFLGANDPYSALKTTLKAEINPEAWATLNSDTSRAFAKPTSGRIAVKVINHLGDEVMKVFKV
jgi:adenine-specific DNA-methyltransferase